MIRFFATLAAVCLLMAAPATAQQRPAGYVTGLDLPDGAPPPVLRRQGEALDVQVWRELFDGDALEVAGKATVTIETARDRRLVVDAARSPHRIEGELGGGGKFATFAATLGELFKSRPDKTAANLIGRNDAAPRLRMGRTRDRQIVVIGQPVWLTWQGGAAPFTVELTGQSRMRKLDIRALASVTTPTNEAKLVVPVEAAGNLTLVVRDADGREARAPLQTQAGAPWTPDWIARGAPTPEMARLARAAYLLSRGPYVWDFYAAGQAAELGSDPARNLLDIVGRGDWPR